MILFAVEDSLSSSLMEIFKRNTNVTMSEVSTEMPVCLSTRTAEKGLKEMACIYHENTIPPPLLPGYSSQQ